MSRCRAAAHEDDSPYLIANRHAISPNRVMSDAPEAKPDATATKAPSWAVQPEPLPQSQWSKPWAQLKFVSFQPAIFPRMLGEVSRDAKPGDLVAVYDKFGHRVGTGLFNPRAKMPLRVVTHSNQPVGEE